MIYADDTEIIESQSTDFEIDNFINNTQTIIGDIDLQEIFNQSVQGNSSKNIILKAIGTLLGKELKSALQMIISVLLIIIVHGILRNLSLNLGNEQTRKNSIFHTNYNANYNINESIYRYFGYCKECNRINVKCYIHINTISNVYVNFYRKCNHSRHSPIFNIIIK